MERGSKKDGEKEKLRVKVWYKKELLMVGKRN